MTSYTVHQLAELADVIVRTLHHYDEIGLLSPSREKNGYRSYGEAELLKLQQILFFRELEFPLEEIAKILKRADFDMAKTLKEHRVRIEQKREKLGAMLGTIEKTLKKLSGEEQMTDEELFEAFWEKHEKEYAAEAEQRWGDTEAFKQSKERTKHMTKEDFKKIAKDEEVFMKKLAGLMSSGPESEELQVMIGQHYESLRTFYDPSPEIYRGLSAMYVADERFRKYYERFGGKLMPEFMRDAMEIFLSRSKQ